MTDWLCSLLTYSLSDWLTHCLTDSLTHWLSDWNDQTDWLKCLGALLHDWLTDWWTDRLTDWTDGTDWLGGWLTDWLPYWLPDSLTGRLADWLTTVSTGFSTSRFHPCFEPFFITLSVAHIPLTFCKPVETLCQERNALLAWHERTPDKWIPRNKTGCTIVV